MCTDLQETSAHWSRLHSLSSLFTDMRTDLTLSCAQLCYRHLFLFHLSLPHFRNPQLTSQITTSPILRRRPSHYTMLTHSSTKKTLSASPPAPASAAEPTTSGTATAPRKPVLKRYRMTKDVRPWHDDSGEWLPEDHDDGNNDKTLVSFKHDGLS